MPQTIFLPLKVANQYGVLENLIFTKRSSILYLLSVQKNSSQSAQPGTDTNYEPDSWKPGN